MTRQRLLKPSPVIKKKKKSELTLSTVHHCRNVSVRPARCLPAYCRLPEYINLNAALASKLHIALTLSLNPFNMYRRLFHCPCLQFPSCPVRVQGSFLAPFALAITQWLISCHLFPLSFCTVLDIADPPQCQRLLLQWSDEPCAAHLTQRDGYQATTQGQLKDQLYQQIINYFDKGKVRDTHAHVLARTCGRLVIIVINPGLWVLFLEAVFC